MIFTIIVNITITVSKTVIYKSNVIEINDLEKK